MGPLSTPRAGKGAQGSHIALCYTPKPCPVPAPARAGSLWWPCIPQDVQQLQQQPRAHLCEAMASLSPYRLCRL